MFGDGPLMFREFISNEPLPLATIQSAMIEFLGDKENAVLCGAQAVNAYVDEARATRDVDILSTRAQPLMHEIRMFLRDRFHMDVRTGSTRCGTGYRVFQFRQPKNRHLVDVRPVESLPPTVMVERVLVVAPAELIASKVISLHMRRKTPKSFSDWRDVAILLLTFPELKAVQGPVRERLEAAGSEADIITAWNAIVAQDIRPNDDDDGY